MWESTSDRTRLLRNRLYGPGRDLRCLLIEKMFLELQVGEFLRAGYPSTLSRQELELSEYGSATNADRQVILQLFELSVHRYRQVSDLSFADRLFIDSTDSSCSASGTLLHTRRLSLFVRHRRRANARAVRRARRTRRASNQSSRLSLLDIPHRFVRYSRAACTSFSAASPSSCRRRARGWQRKSSGH